MKCVFISDTHNYHNHLDLPDGDILIHAGDFTLTGTLHEVLDFKDWFEKQEHPYKVVIAGNHDRVLGENELLGFKMFTNSYYLLNSGVTIEGLKIWGGPMTPAFNGMRSGLTFYTNSDREAKAVWRGMPKNLDILLTHGPPLYVLDEVKDDIGGIVCCGDGMLASKVIQKKPRYHAFGHIHEGYGIFKADYGTTFINCSVVNEKYNVVNKPIEVEINV